MKNEQHVLHPDDQITVIIRVIHAKNVSTKNTAISLCVFCLSVHGSTVRQTDEKRRRSRDVTTKIDTRGMSSEQILKVWSVNIRSRRMTQSSGSLEKSVTTCLVCLCLSCLPCLPFLSVFTPLPVSSYVCIRMFPLRFTWSQWVVKRKDCLPSAFSVLSSPSTSVFLSC